MNDLSEGRNAHRVRPGVSSWRRTILKQGPPTSQRVQSRTEGRKQRHQPRVRRDIDDGHPSRTPR